MERVGIERPDGPVIDAPAQGQLKLLRSRYGSAGNMDDRFDAYVLGRGVGLPCPPPGRVRFSAAEGGAPP